MKKVYFIIFFTLIFTFGFAGGFVNAQSSLDNAIEASNPTLEPPTTCRTLEGCFNRWTNMLIIFTTPIYTLMLAIAGFNFIFGGANPGRIQKAKDILKYSTIGFLVVSFARGITSVVLVLTL